MSGYKPNTIFRFSPGDRANLAAVARRLGTSRSEAVRRLVAGYLGVLDDLKEVRADRRAVATSSRDLPGVERH